MTEEIGAPATSEVIAPEVEKVEVEQPRSMDDTIRDTLRELTAKKDVVEVDSQSDVPQSDEEKAQRIRDEKGKFSKEAEKPADATIAPVAPVNESPKSFRKEIADKHWSKLDPEFQAEIIRRETDFNKGIEGYKAAATFAQTVDKAMQPYSATLQQLGITPDKAISELMASDHRLRHGSPQDKHTFFAQLAQSYGIDMGVVQSALQQVPQVDPQLSGLQSQVRQLEGWIKNQTMMGERKEQDKLQNEISAFSADPSHSHFEMVKGHMAALLQAGQAKDLSDAYEQAIYANPATRQSVLALQQATKDAETAKAQAEAKAAAAKKVNAAKLGASVNTRSRPSMPASQPIGTMDDTIRATLRKLQAA